MEKPEIWLWRRMERVSWAKGKTNENLLNMIHESRQIVRAAIERKKKWIEHQMRQGDGGFLRRYRGKDGEKKYWEEKHTNVK
jgi:hypothetical protein